jgi:HSP20 family molecular chaperone IbpA
MSKDDSQTWMWSEAVEMLARAERMHRHFFKPPGRQGETGWEPPVDVIETDHAVLILIALPGVAAERVEAVVQDGTLVVSGRRVLPPELRTAIIHRMELPQGRFERRIALPPGRYDAVRRTAADGCLLISLHKVQR